MNYIKITKNDIANGEGLRVTLWLSGCSHNCKGCHNPQTHNPINGILFDEKAEDEIFQELNKPYIAGLTFSGGDPLHENNLQDVLNLVNKIRLLLPNKTIWLYTGYTWEKCLEHPLRKEIASKCDIVVDGRYIDELRNTTLKWRGSSNQRIIDSQKSFCEERIILYDN